jgi:RNA polymerase sigma factor (sigma-70 family)
MIWVTGAMCPMTLDRGAAESSKDPCDHMQMKTEAVPALYSGSARDGPEEPRLGPAPEAVSSDERLEELLLRAKHGDSEAFWRLVEPGIPRLYRSCFALCGQHPDAEDLVQDTLLLGWRRISTLRNATGAIAWLAVIATRIYLRRLRSRVGTQSLDMLPEVPAESDARGFVEWLVGLPADQRALLILRYYYGQPLEDISQILGVKAGTIRSRLYYLLRRFRHESGL